MKNPFSKIFARFARKKETQPAPQPAQKPAPAANNPPPPGVVLRHAEGTDRVEFKGVVLNDAEGKPFIDFGSIALAPGDRMMVCGPAGCGKSATLAAMRDAWMLGGGGEITLPPEVRFVPQEEYFPDRTLRGLVCSPDPLSRFTPEQVAQALTEAGLADFVAAMDDPTKKGEYWKNTLSGGQRNKLAIAGIFLHAAETKVLVVDEISAALDAQSEAALYPQILERMRHGIVISVAHHDVLLPLHNVVASVKDGKVTYTKTPPAAPAPKGANENNPAPSVQPPKVG